MAVSLVNRLRGRGLPGFVVYLLLQALLNRPGPSGDFRSWKDRLLPRQYPAELRQRAVRLVMEQRDQYQAEFEAIRSIVVRLGSTPAETLRRWVRQAEIDPGQGPVASLRESTELRRLRAENKELRRTNDILKAACAFFAAELDRSTPRL
jgi:transposase